MSQKIVGRQDSLFNYIKQDVKGELGIDEEFLGVTLTFKRGGKSSSSVFFQEFPLMGRETESIRQQVMTGVSPVLLSSGITSIFVGAKGEVRIYVNNERRDFDPFGRAVLREHLCTKFDLTGRAQRLKEEVEEVKGMPMELHENVCKATVRKYLRHAIKHHRTVTSHDDVLFTLHCVEDQKQLLPVDQGKPFVSIPMPLQHNALTYEFYWTWVHVFAHGYRTLINYYFYDIAREMLGDSGGVLTRTFELTGAKSYEQ